jgi:RNA polymerase sigma-70 factor (ECF subfamily)
LRAWLERKYLTLADPQRGRFRTFLLSSLKNFLITEWQKSHALKRGGAHAIFSWAEQNAEERYLAEPMDGLTPERIYEKRWAVTLLEHVMARLRHQYSADGKGPLFDALKPYVWDETMTEGYGSIAKRLNLSEGALRVAMHRLRESFRELLRAEIASTVGSPAEIDDELRHLVAALRN